MDGGVLVSILRAIQADLAQVKRQGAAQGLLLGELMVEARMIKAAVDDIARRDWRPPPRFRLADLTTRFEQLEADKTE